MPTSTTSMASWSCDLLVFIFFFVVVPSVNSIHYRFDPTKNNIIYNGDAEPNSDGFIEMNKISLRGRVGSAIYPDKVPLWDSGTGQLSDFTTRFSFVIDTLNSTMFGDGLAFFLAPFGYQIALNSAGGCLGLCMFESRVVLVEFDTFSDSGWDPTDMKSHVGINNKSVISAVYTQWNASIHSGDTADVLIAYNATTKNLSVSWSYRETSDSKENTSLFYLIDLRNTLPEWVTIGFSASTGVYTERHLLKSWEFNSTLDIKEKNKMNARSEIQIVAAVVPVGVLVVVVTAGLVIFLRWKQMKRNSTAANLTSITNEFERDRAGGPRRFCCGELASATNNFSAERKLGQGGFGAVYRGHLVALDKTVAVKKVSRGSKQGKKEYTTEVQTCSQLRHRNLVQLIGWCHDKDEFLLVYEFMSNGSLDTHLFGKKSTLTWAVRYKISLGLASALLYLHEEWERCVVHRDIKSSNIMLDSNFNVKLGDFGLARLVDHELGPKTTGLAGTLGYMAPEYISTGRASKESDIYSFGVVALEIATGRRSATPMKENPEMGLVEWVWDLYSKEKLLSGIDERLDMNFDEKQMKRLMMVGLWSAHPNRGFRPSIRLAIQVLNLEAEVPNIPTKMPPLIHHSPTPPISSGEPFLTNSSSGIGR
ncbi:hypothetical protein Ddye_003079 [Dipteronia dyeriana]|uniref:Protein kinase domain-containing protein n=1 Tax=Dipteronia dyeriana TaxID=168575 RepID=A0AAD9XSD4_9ROSI|nr:hypothetical protein Ddye_003079 [Dipteronia dyeriana]